MEIQTTMVQFRFPKAMMQKSDKAHLFMCGKDSEKIWIPFTKTEVSADPLDDAYNIVIMPKWLYLKGNLPLYTQAKEFTYTHKYVENN